MASWRNTRIRLWLEQGGKCYYCACKTKLMMLKQYRKPPPHMATLDHIIPLSAGGARGPSINCVVACDKCNGERGTRDARLFLLEKMGLA